MCCDIVTAAFLAALLSPAAAQKPPLDLSRPVVDLLGKPVPDGALITPGDPNCDKCAPLTLAGAAARSLVTAIDTDKAGDPLQSVSRFVLAQRIITHPGAVVLTTEEIVILKNRIGRTWPALIAGQTILAIDPDMDRPALKQ